jgi:formylglycine-generating enzyme required for sulfatase activity
MIDGAEMAKAALDGLTTAYAEWIAFDPVFVHEKAAAVDYAALKLSLDQKTEDRFGEVLGLSLRYRGEYQPEKSFAMVEPWTNITFHDPVKARAARELRTLTYVVSLHGDARTEDRMKYMPDAAVQIGEDPIGPSWMHVHKPSSPIHTKNIAAFHIDRTEVTNEQYYAFLMDQYGSADKAAEFKRRVPAWWNGLTVPVGLERHPVRGISVEEAKDFAAWAGKRLPTEEEWEYAARGPAAYPEGMKTQRLYPWSPVFGDQAWDRYGRVRVPASERVKTTEVGRYEQTKSEPAGLYDMNGNVLEWTSSAYVQYPGNELRDDYGPHKIVARGGAYDSMRDNEVKVTTRFPFLVGSKPENVGFRCVKDAVVARQ